MGLDTSHGCYSGGYCSFNHWRNKLAQLSGYKLCPDEDCSWLEVPDLNWDSFTDKNFYGKWENEPDDILIILLAHCDNEGYIYKEHTSKLADRIEYLLQKQWKELNQYTLFGKKTKDPFLCKKLRSYIDISTEFIEGLRKASKRNQKITFS